MLQVGVVGVDHELAAADRRPLDVVEVGLQLQRRAVGEGVVPAPEHVAAGDDLIAAGLGLVAAVIVPLEQHVVGVRGRPVEAQAALRLVPVVAGARAGGSLGVVGPGFLGVDPVGQVGAHPPAVLNERVGLLIAAADLDEAALGVAGFAGDDVDDAVDRIGAPERGARAADHLDALDVLGRDRLHVPVDAGEQRRVDAAPVDQHQQLVGERLRRVVAAEAARRDHIVAGAGLVDLQIGREAQNFRDAGGAGADDVIVGDHVDRRRRVAQRLGGLRGRGHVDVGQLVDRHVLQIFDRLGRGLRGQSGQGYRASARHGVGKSSRPHRPLPPQSGLNAGSAAGVPYTEDYFIRPAPPTARLRDRRW